MLDCAYNIGFPNKLFNHGIFARFKTFLFCLPRALLCKTCTTQSKQRHAFLDTHTSFRIHFVDKYCKSPTLLGELSVIDYDEDFMFSSAMQEEPTCNDAQQLSMYQKAFNQVVQRRTCKSNCIRLWASVKRYDEVLDFLALKDSRMTKNPFTSHAFS